MKWMPFLVLAVFFMSQPYLGQIRQLPSSADELLLHVNIVNNNDEDWDDVKVSVYLYELGLFGRSSLIDVDDNTNDSVLVRIPAHYVMPGWYLAKISLIGEQGTIDVDYRDVEVI